MNLTVTVALVIGLVIGVSTHNFVAGTQTFLVTLVTSGLNIDNVLMLIPIVRNLSPVGQLIFMTVGMAISVLGVMLFCPMLFLALITGMPLGDAIHMAIFDGQQFSVVLDDRVSQFIQVGAMTFLGLLALTELMSPHKNQHWLPIERLMARFAKWWGAAGEIIVLIPAFLICALARTNARALLFGVMMGTYIAFKCFKQLSEKLLAKSGHTVEDGRWFHALMWWVFGCLLEAIFSIDGLASAFAITSDMLPIAIGAVTGTLIMRLMTMKLAKIDIMGRFQHLSQALFWAIMTLSVASGFAVCGIRIPDIIPGVLPLIIIFGGGYHSHRKNKRPQPSRDLLGVR